MKTKITDSSILVTGGAGFIGSYLVEKLIENSPKKIIIIDNLIRGSYVNMENFIENPIVKFIEADLNDSMLLEKCISEVEYVYHMAALRINACAADPINAYDTMVKVTFNIVELSKRYNIKKVIYSSSASIYGNAQNFPTSETENPYDNKTFYGVAKMFGEQLLRSYKFMFGLDYVALRYFNVYGPRMDTDGKYTEVMIKWLDCINENKNPLIHGDGSMSMDFIYVEDVARANVEALLSDVTDEVFNIGIKRETSLKELINILLKINNSELKPVFLDNNTVNPVSRRFAENKKAIEHLNFTPQITLGEGLKKLSKWYFEKSKTTVE